ncbi:MAG: hypothetical protein GXO45_01390 [Aquificae bacterium]|nr:hypothetical protein [Aquificota bacterium]
MKTQQVAVSTLLTNKKAKKSSKKTDLFKAIFERMKNQTKTDRSVNTQKQIALTLPNNQQLNTEKTDTKQTTHNKKTEKQLKKAETTAIYTEGQPERLLSTEERNIQRPTKTGLTETKAENRKAEKQTAEKPPLQSGQDNIKVLDTVKQTGSEQSTNSLGKTADNIKETDKQTPQLKVDFTQPKAKKVVSKDSRQPKTTAIEEKLPLDTAYKIEKTAVENTIHQTKATAGRTDTPQQQAEKQPTKAVENSKKSAGEQSRQTAVKQLEKQLQDTVKENNLLAPSDREKGHKHITAKSEKTEKLSDIKATYQQTYTVAVETGKAVENHLTTADNKADNRKHRQTLQTGLKGDFTQPKAKKVISKDSRQPKTTATEEKLPLDTAYKTEKTAVDNTTHQIKATAERTDTPQQQTVKQPTKTVENNKKLAVEQAEQTTFNQLNIGETTAKQKGKQPQNITTKDNSYQFVAKAGERELEREEVKKEDKKANTVVNTQRQTHYTKVVENTDKQEGIAEVNQDRVIHWENKVETKHQTSHRATGELLDRQPVETVSGGNTNNNSNSWEGGDSQQGFSYTNTDSQEGLQEEKNFHRNLTLNLRINDLTLKANYNGNRLNLSILMKDATTVSLDTLSSDISNIIQESGIEEFMVRIRNKDREYSFYSGGRKKVKTAFGREVNVKA